MGRNLHVMRVMLRALAPETEFLETLRAVAAGEYDDLLTFLRQRWTDDQRQEVIRLTEAAMRSRDSGNVAQLVVDVFDLGIAMPRMPFERLLSMTRSREDRARDMGTGRKLSADKVEERRAECQRAVEDMMRRNPHMKYLLACERVGQSLTPRRSVRWVRGYTTNPRKKL